jgi:hypothetical protein
MHKLIILLSFSGWTPLHFSAGNGDLKLCRLLVVSKADVAVRDECFSPPTPPPLSPSFTHYLPCSDGETALKYAIDFDNADVAAYLHSIGAPQ